MDLVELMGLFGIMAVMAAVPSTSVLLIVSNSTTFGLYSGIASAVGVVSGDLLYAVLAIAGATLAAEMLGEYFVVAKYIGGFYLVWFGISLLLGNGVARKPEKKDGSLLWSYLVGLLLTLSDLKAVFFYASILPSFVEIEQLSLGVVAAIAFMTVVTVGSVKLGYAYAAHHAAMRARRIGCGELVEKLAGSISIGVGALVVART